MKRVFCLILLQTLLGTQLWGQAKWIDTMFVVPQHPTTSDPTTVHVHYYLPSPEAGWKTQLDTPNLTAIADFCCCGGAMISTHVDTFNLPPLTSGVHYFKMDFNWVDAQKACDSIFFSVKDSLRIFIAGGAATGLSNFGIIPFTAFYKDGQLKVQSLPQDGTFDLRIVNLAGSVVMRSRDCHQNARIPVELSAGLYMLQVTQNHLQLITRILVD